MIFTLIFWASIFLLAHSYLLYPGILQIIARKKKLNSPFYKPDDELPFISIVMSVHNEEDVIAKKIKSIYHTDYPLNKLEVLIGSDASTDGTNRVCNIYEKNYSNFRFFPFIERQGKPSVINKLVAEAKAEILILTDAKVYFTGNTLFELIKYFKNDKVDIVGGNIINQKTQKDGISFQEKTFMNREIVIKYNEGLLWGKTIGIYGAIYAIRKNSFTNVPEGYSVDDFFITMNVLKNKGRAIMNLNAITMEEVPNLIKTEFKRKVRISTGNFQNLRHFAICLWPLYSSLGFAFFSHKVIRWFGPLLILSIFISNLFLVHVNMFYQVVFILQIFLLSIPLIDLLLRKFNVHVVFLRFITHFFAMNIALLIGLFKYILGIKSNIWQPTRR
jgi:cellulose synthase/poly-beta-1,6-N-acetylglucosamine synthase-like glycosyltransferase